MSTHDDEPPTRDPAPEMIPYRDDPGTPGDSGDDPWPTPNPNLPEPRLPEWAE